MNYLAAEHYLPHAAPMVLLEEVLEVGENTACCRVRVSPEGVLAPFLDQLGQLPAWFAIELMAQTVGVWSGWHGEQNGNKPRVGMLLGGRAMKCTMATFPAGSLLTVNVTLLLQDEKLASFECEISMNTGLDNAHRAATQAVAQARLNTYRPETEELKTLIKGAAL